MNEILIHIGAPKTGSTTLQRAFFAKHNSLHYFGEQGDGCERPEDADIINSMIFDDDIFYKKEECKNLFLEHRRKAEGLKLIYSNGDVMTSRIPTVCAVRLRELLPDARAIIIVVRNQLTAIPSYYANHGAYLKPAPPPYYRRYVRFDDWIAYCSMFLQHSPLANFLYDKIISVYEELFGKEKIKILIYEDFIENRQKFISELCEILRVPIGEALPLISGHHERRRNTGRLLNYHRLRSSLFWGIHFSQYFLFGKTLAKAFESFLNRGPAANIKISPKWKRVIEKIYAEDNAKLMKEYRLDLKKYNYPLPD